MPSSERDYWKKKPKKKSPYDEICISVFRTEDPNKFHITKNIKYKEEAMPSIERDYWKTEQKKPKKKKTGLKEFFKKFCKKKPNTPYDDMPEEPTETIYTNPYQDE